MLGVNKWSEICIMVRENSIAVCVRNVKFRFLIDRRNIDWLLLIYMYVQFEVVERWIFSVCKNHDGWSSSGLPQGFRNP